MSTLTQVWQLGSERLSGTPLPPHHSLAAAWATLPWTEDKETALLKANTLAQGARAAGSLSRAGQVPPPPAAEDSGPAASVAAMTILRRLMNPDWSSLVDEGLELCARQGLRVGPSLLPALFEHCQSPAQRSLLRQVGGERAAWLATQNPAWAWYRSGQSAEAPRRTNADQPPGSNETHPAAKPPASSPQDTENSAAASPALWETGTPEERLELFRALRGRAPDEARLLLERTWKDEEGDMRKDLLAALETGLGAADEAFLRKALGERRRELRALAQSLLARIPGSAYAKRLFTLAQPCLVLRQSEGALSTLEVSLPEQFSAEWKAEGLEEKPPVGTGARAYWLSQMLALVPPSEWARHLGLEVESLIERAAASSDWAELLLSAWMQAAALHRDSRACAALLLALVKRQQTPGLLPTQGTALAQSLLAACEPAVAWDLAGRLPEVTWLAVPQLTGTPTPSQAAAVLGLLCPALREGFNPGGSAGALKAARLLPPSLHAEASRLLQREHGLSKPAESFLQALELRAILHEAFN